MLLPQILFTYTLHSGHTLLWHQFPLVPAYATTFNNCQGLTLDHVEINLTVPMFLHGQLYTALSQICYLPHARLVILKQFLSTTNVTYMKLLT